MENQTCLEKAQPNGRIKGCDLDVAALSVQAYKPSNIYVWEDIFIAIRQLCLTGLHRL